MLECIDTPADNVTFLLCILPLCLAQIGGLPRGSLQHIDTPAANVTFHLCIVQHAWYRSVAA